MARFKCHIHVSYGIVTLENSTKSGNLAVQTSSQGLREMWCVTYRHHDDFRVPVFVPLVAVHHEAPSVHGGSHGVLGQGFVAQQRTQAVLFYYTIFYFVGRDGRSHQVAAQLGEQHQSKEHGVDRDHGIDDVRSWRPMLILSCSTTGVTEISPVLYTELLKTTSCLLQGCIRLQVTRRLKVTTNVSCFS